MDELPSKINWKKSACPITVQQFTCLPCVGYGLIPWIISAGAFSENSNKQKRTL
jgi:hypothetical protein